MDTERKLKEDSSNELRKITTFLQDLKNTYHSHFLSFVSFVCEESGLRKLSHPSILSQNLVFHSSLNPRNFLP